MTTHARQQIRQAVATACTGLTTTGSRVHQSRMRPATDAGLPCLLISTGDESIEASVQAHQARTLIVTVRGLAKVAADLDDTLDAMALEVETAIQSAGTLSGLVPGRLQLISISTDFDDSLDKPAGQIVLEFKAGYFTASGSPGAIV